MRCKRHFGGAGAVTTKQNPTTVLIITEHRSTLTHSITVPGYLVIAGVDPARQLVYGFIQARFLLLHVGGPLRVAQVVDEVGTNLQPPAHVLLQNLLVKIVHVVIFLHASVEKSRSRSL